MATVLDDHISRSSGLSADHVKALEPYKDQERAKFPIMEIFGPTIQGEGMMVGEKTMFVRFGGCDYRCGMCDSLHAVIPQLVKAHGTWRDSQDIFSIIKSRQSPEQTPWVTLSGGNPAMWDLTNLVVLLQEAGYKVAVETQGSIWRDWLAQVDVLTICPKGPGMEERFQPEVFASFLAHIENAHNRLMGRLHVCIKSVVFNQMDFEFAVGVDAILDARGKEYWPKHDRYLSLGNDCPPVVLPDGTMQTDELHPEMGGRQFKDLPAYLLWKYELLLGDYLQDARLSHWKFLPQLHVLVWSNKAGV